MAGWTKKKVLIAVRTYPVPARKNIEVSCTAGISQEGDWIRLFPVPYRFLDEDSRFRKYQWIEVDVIKASDDPRPESYKLNVDTIRTGASLPTDEGWRARREALRPLARPSMCAIQRERGEKQYPTLGFFRPAQIKRLAIERLKEVDWTPEQLGMLQQIPMFQSAPPGTLEKIPWSFKYQFVCSDPHCTGHEMSCTDWEMGQSYRHWRKKYGIGWEQKFRQRYEQEMINKYDTHFFVGTIHKHPHVWIIVGLFYPPKSSRDLFD
jgi:hypothetical protein